ncbi:MAG TPA: 50S ribosomal protein L28 [Kofleriaceae bacterium]|nr:50S ribosomal protein L28 [Kofleriaceae bacterium]
MSRVCTITGKKPLVGNRVSHSNRKSKRRLEVNLRTKRFWFEEEGRWIRLRLSARAMRLIDKVGLAQVVKQLRAQGERI